MRSWYQDVLPAQTLATVRLSCDLVIGLDAYQYLSKNLPRPSVITFQGAQALATAPGTASKYPVEGFCDTLSVIAIWTILAMCSGIVIHFWVMPFSKIVLSEVQAFRQALKD
ncbi:uncharacterized protein MELLADRAFT_104658 [Melampsora larici-populina 98AG31]|uniref:Uncharacterized protein n=1 Tax=Melampsora larici-populina (strain 98AG31 / pathotype 3-4-7) TaxID=747676 RepID=F4RFH0_MELLP|nr:uncharacterized protein MELLADRAFT_104658 [Melampsora larici-populina 98AG31]EGG08806.1 hypothetical protein MELLADRAFT_104658 [Melampsora larici-populina 98AG31]